MRVPENDALPTLVVIGTMKGGTSSLYHYLREHPDVFMSTPKELNYFSDDDVFAKGQEWYRAYFDEAEARHARVRGEASPRYSMASASPATAGRMHALVPDARLVYVVRDPIARIQSHYQHRLRHGEPLRPIDVEVLDDPVYIGTSAYATRLAPFLDLFPRERVMVLTSEALLADRAATVASVCRFIGVDPSVEIGALADEYNRAAGRRVPRTRLRRLRRNRVVASFVDRVPRSVRARVGGVTGIESSTPTLSPATREVLAERLADDVRRLRPLMPADFDGWGIA